MLFPNCIFDCSMLFLCVTEIVSKGGLVLLLCCSYVVLGCSCIVLVLPLCCSDVVPLLVLRYV